MAYSALAHEDRAHKLGDLEQSRYHQRRVDLLTPLVKGWCTEISLEVASLGIQVHGGMGYVEETGAAQHLRDARILPIYEGTNGIQAMDLVGRKTARDQGLGAMELIKDLHPVLREAGDAGLPVIAESLSASLADLKEAVEVLLAGATDENWATPGAVAHNLLMLMGTCVAGAMLAKSAVAASKLQKVDSGNPLFNSSKLTTANFFAEHVLPRTASYLAAVKAGSDSVMALDIDAF